MAPKRIVIVGGVAAGMSAAAKARRCSEAVEITVYERDAYVSYAGCGLPYHIGGVIPRREDLVVVTPEFFAERFNVGVKVRHEVRAVDAAARTVRVRDLERGHEFTHDYDELILATGARPFVPPIPGRDLPFVFTLRTLGDMERIIAHLGRHEAVRAAVIGGGLIGIECAEALGELGARVTVVEALDRVLPFLDWDMSQPVVRELEAHEVTVLTSERVLAIEAVNGGGVVHTTADRLPVNLVLIATGVRPETTLAQALGLELGAAGAIRVDEYLRTSREGIWAAGDCADSVQLVSGQRVWLPMGSTANKQGRAAGANAVLGPEIRFPGVLGTTIVKVFALQAAKTGLSATEARNLGLEPVVAHVHATSHASYYPRALPLQIKTVSAPDGRLLGAQVVGRGGVDKRIDVLATAVYNRMRTEDLAHLDLAYAPPFSSAKDPVVLGGLVAENQRRGDLRLVTAAALERRLAAGDERLLLLDVRSSAERRQDGYLAGDVHIPLHELRSRLGELEPYRGRDIVIVCRAGLRAYLAARILAHNGFRGVSVLSGGLLSWHYPQAPADGSS